MTEHDYPEQLDDITIPVEEFAKQKGIATERVIEMIKDGYYSGHLEEGEWFVNDHDRSAKKAGGNSEPMLPTIFYSLGALSFLGGIILLVMLNLNDRDAIFYLVLGTVQCALFVAIGQGLSYLHQIVVNTSKD